MRVTVSSFWLPRDGSPVEHYEDAFCPRRTGPSSGSPLRVAVADGASESMLSGLWAELLVRTWCRTRRQGMDDVVAAAMCFWHDALEAYLESRRVEQRPIEWFEQPGLDRGAHATLLGLELGTTSAGVGRWRAESLGDSCLFHVSHDALVTAFPLQEASAFSNAPKLVPTKRAQFSRVVSAVDRAEGGCEAGDLLFLTTDAVAAWFLASTERGGTPWRELAAIPRDDADAFASWALTQRTAGRLRNDDATLVRVEVGAA